MKGPSRNLSDQTRNALLIADTAWAVLSEEHPTWSIDELLLHPAEEMEVCRIVRRQLGQKLDDDQILRRLLNGRKRGWIDPAGLRRTAGRKRRPR